MLRRIAIAGLLLAVLACGAGAWAAARRATDAFIAPGAAGVQVARNGLGQQLITYHMPNPADGWQTAIARRLSLSGWRLAADRYQWGDTEKYKIVYLRTTRLWSLKLCERAELLGDRSFAVIAVSYRLGCA